MFADLRQQVGTPPLELLVAEFPELALFACLVVLDTKATGLDLSEPVEVQLAHKRGKVVVFKIIRNYHRGESISILDDEGFSIIIPVLKDKK